MANSSIEWTDLVWNPVTGCDKVSQGCKNCYAEVMHRRLMGMFPEKYSKPFLGNIQLHEDELLKALKFPKGKKVFVNSMSDLFHKDVPFDFIDNVFAVMDCRPDLTFQIVTKRAERAHEYFNEKREWRVGQLKYAYNSEDRDLSGWPLKNVWLGVSCEDQQQADARIPYLLKTPAAVRFVSCEPLLSKIDISKYVQPLTAHSYQLHKSIGEPVIDWVIVGGESGSKARPMHPDWVRSIRDACRYTCGVAFFFKQWGEWVPGEYSISFSWKRVRSMRKIIARTVVHNMIAYDMYPVGKKLSGNYLDGKQHLEFPKGGTNG